MTSFFEEKSRERSRLKKLKGSHMRSASVQDIINGTAPFNYA
jgi:hypothetical protein